MKTIFAFTVFFGLSYSAIAGLQHSSDSNPFSKQENPKKINPAQMTLPFFNILPIAVKKDSLSNKTNNLPAIIKTPNIIDPRFFQYKMEKTN